MQLNYSDPLVEKAVTALRMLAVDAVEKANSGHPGMPMGAADYAFVLWMKHLRFNPADPDWPDRDRFVLSAGHGSMLLYALLHLFDYDLSLDDLRNFRQWGSKTPGHPERGHAPGVETTTGPLGQGFGNGVGMALAAKMLAARFNRPGEDIVTHRVFAICSDGDMMEGVASEAASIAGHLGLDNLIYLYDDNHITIEGKTDLAFSEDVGRRFEAYNWFVQRIDGHDRDAADQAIAAAVAEPDRPSLIICRTHIAKGSPNMQDTARSHGEPLGKDEVEATKRAYGWPLEPTFLVPEEVRGLFRRRVAELRPEYDSWHKRFVGYRGRYPEAALLWDKHLNAWAPENIEELLLAAAPKKDTATRGASGAVIQAAAKHVPALVGGSADLAPSTKTLIDDSSDVERGSFAGRNFHFGVREHGMGAITNGLALHGGFIPFCATFLIFSDYMRPTIRLAAMMRAHCIYVFTHDSVFLGEDGPTHEPIEHYAALRAIPNLAVIRPADPAEVAVAWAVALQRQAGPTALLLTRQNVPALDRTVLAPAAGLRRGAYVLSEAPSGQPDMLLIATGSEVQLALGAQQNLWKENIAARVVSMPSHSLFEAQSEEYRREVLPPEVTARVSIEAGVSFGWDRYVGPQGLIIGLDRYGASAPYKVIAQHLGFTVEAVTSAALDYWRLCCR
jgi:transketolase